ncbi:hypothetical protein GQ600_12838 [Phytophthora cactorum]|nr:hypothetical protein GQ600_12838 [Phytophthora cactorum]
MVTKRSRPRVGADVSYDVRGLQSTTMALTSAERELKLDEKFIWTETDQDTIMCKNDLDVTVAAVMITLKQFGFCLEKTRPARWTSSTCMRPRNLGQRTATRTWSSEVVLLPAALGISLTPATTRPRALHQASSGFGKSRIAAISREHGRMKASRACG